jgi:hypothetical protein
MLPEQRNEKRDFPQLLRADERLERHETVRFVRGGKTVAVSLSMSPVRNSTGKLMDFSNIAHEIIDRQLGIASSRG